MLVPQKTLAEKTMAEDSEKAFTISILHDAGRIPFFIYGDRYREIQAEAHRTSRDVCFIEREAFDIDHAEPGHFVSVKLSFPKSGHPFHDEVYPDVLSHKDHRHVSEQ